MYVCVCVFLCVACASVVFSLSGRSCMIFIPKLKSLNVSCTHPLLQARLLLDLCAELGLQEVVLAGHADGSLLALKAVSMLPE